MATAWYDNNLVTKLVFYNLEENHSLDPVSTQIYVDRQSDVYHIDCSK